MIDKLEVACIRFVHFSNENEVRSRVSTCTCVLLIDLSFHSWKSMILQNLAGYFSIFMWTNNDLTVQYIYGHHLNHMGKKMTRSLFIRKCKTYGIQTMHGW